MTIKITYELYVPKKKKLTNKVKSKIVKIDNFQENMINEVCERFESEVNYMLSCNFSDYLCSVKKVNIL